MVQYSIAAERRREMRGSDSQFFGIILLGMAAAMALALLLGGHESVGPRVSVAMLAVAGVLMVGASRQSFGPLIRFAGRALEVAFFGTVVAIGVVGSIWATGMAGLWILAAAVLAGLTLWAWDWWQKFISRRRNG